MKNILQILLFLTPMFAISQDLKMEEKSITGIFEAKSYNKSEIYSLLNKWVSINYKSAKAVIQLNDLESGTIIIKGINTVVFKNRTKEVYPNIKSIPEYTTCNFNHQIEIDIKDNKFRVIFTIIDLISSDQIYSSSSFFDCISFNNTNEIAIEKYTKMNDDIYKKYMVGKGKREKMRSIMKPMFDEIKESLILDIKLTMNSIEKFVSTSSKDDW